MRRSGYPGDQVPQHYESQVHSRQVLELDPMGRRSTLSGRAPNIHYCINEYNTSQLYDVRKSDISQDGNVIHATDLFTGQ
jgi:hypothetical protein